MVDEDHAGINSVMCSSVYVTPEQPHGLKYSLVVLDAKILSKRNIRFLLHIGSLRSFKSKPDCSLLIEPCS